MDKQQNPDSKKGGGSAGGPNSLFDFEGEGRNAV